MKRTLLLGSILAMTMLVVAFNHLHTPRNTVMAADEAKQSQLAHMVFFTCANATDRDKLVANCKKYLGEHPGTVHFSVGTRNTELTREVNDQDYDVALHLIFKDKASQDVYQDAPRHKQFVDESKMLWKKVRVFDSDIR